MKKIIQNKMKKKRKKKNEKMRRKEKRENREKRRKEKEELSKEREIEIHVKDYQINKEGNDFLYDNLNQKGRQRRKEKEKKQIISFCRVMYVVKYVFILLLICIVIKSLSH